MLNLVKTVMRRHNILWSGRKEPPMHYGRRSDLALEAKELFESSAGKTTQLSGVRAREETLFGYPLTRVDILDETGAEALGKPVGRYVTVDLGPYFRREADYFDRGVRCLAGELAALLPEGPVLAAGLGNRAMTCDAVGPASIDNLLVTRHMIRAMPRQFADFRPVAAVCPGVLARTGLEALELVRGAVERVRPAAVIAVDALAARDSARLCATVQLSDTGLVPGSGVGNRRSALDRGTLGVPVIAVGIPTVVDADPRAGLFLTPRDIDQRIRELGRLLGYGITLALQPSLTAADITALLG